VTLQNRILPDGAIVAQNWRGTLMGNRGGRIHDPETRTLLKRKWASKRWIICVTEFKNRQRKVMGKSYTELFFLDEVSALATGHRPCFECRRKDANAFGEAWVAANGRPEGSMADGMDTILHDERIHEKRILNYPQLSDLPHGSMVQTGQRYFAKKQSKFLEWTSHGYKYVKLPDEPLILLTPPSIIKVLRQGFEPKWHPSAQ